MEREELFWGAALCQNPELGGGARLTKGCRKSVRQRGLHRPQPQRQDARTDPNLFPIFPHLKFTIFLGLPVPPHDDLWTLIPPRL